MLSSRSPLATRSLIGLRNIGNACCIIDLYETSNSTRGALRGKSNAELFQILICRFSVSRKKLLCAAWNKIWYGFIVMLAFVTVVEWTVWKASWLCCSCHWTVGSDNGAGVLTWSMWRKLKLIQTSRFSWKPGCLLDHIAVLFTVGQAEFHFEFSSCTLRNMCKVTSSHWFAHRHKVGKGKKLLLRHYRDSETQFFKLQNSEVGVRLH
jgi:hypothetical protein